MKGEPEMAKKVKTPEEVRATIEKRVAKRTLFFGTFRKALAFFLAVAFTFALVQVAFTAKNGAVVSTGTNTGTNTSTSTGTDNGNTSTGGDDALVDLGGDDQTPADDNNGGATQDANKPADDNSGSSNSGSADSSKADIIKLVNDATAVAAKAGYNWTRKCVYTRPLDVGNATDTLNGVIHRVDENASLESVVGGFLDITGDGAPLSAKKAKGSAAPEGMKDKFLLKAMTLTEGDVAQAVKQGDVYKIQVNSCENPQKDGNNPLHHATNDFTTMDETAQGISDALGSISNLIKLQALNVKFTNIVIAAEIKDGKLNSLSLNYDFDVTSLQLKALSMVNVEGNGAAKVEETYKNFAY